MKNEKFVWCRLLYFSFFILNFSFFSAAQNLLMAGDSLATAALSANAPEGFQDNGVPHFLVFGKKDKFFLGIGGQVKVTAGADLGHVIASPDEFTTSQIPMSPDPGNGMDFRFSARQSQLYLNMVALPDTKNAIGAFFSANLLHDNYSPAIIYAYMRWRGLQAGYDYNLFSDSSAAPPSIDYEGSPNILALNTAGVRYNLSFGPGKHWNIAVALENPCASFTNPVLGGVTIDEQVKQRVPDIPIALKYSWNEGASHVRLSTVLRNMYSFNDLARRRIDRFGWGLHLSNMLQITPDLVTYVSGVYGRGIASYFQDLSDGGLDLVPTPDGSRFEAVPVWGAYGAVQYNITSHVLVSGCYSQVRTYVDKYREGQTPWPDQYKYAQYVSGTVLWNLNHYLTAGAEYIWGRRADYSDAKAADTRIQAMVSFNF